ncbi:MAG TPA: hypothetical protein DDW93_09750 [Firmicutes bacterium]|jgi:hypothetical protein|nr:hypothetical protein [Bacillota bacterium]HBK70036.1 hypothetical protein [Bacillota bacterium]HBT15633.1 hypothetical protein [Bacillota bacterium]
MGYILLKKDLSGKGRIRKESPPLYGGVLVVEGDLLKKILLFTIGFVLILLGVLGISIPLLVYIYAREWAGSLFNLMPALIIIFYLPLVCWILITGIGLVARRSWAWYSSQTLFIFLIFLGIILITILNSLSFLENLRLTWDQIKIVGNIGLILLLVVTPLSSLIFFSGYKSEKWSSGSGPENLEDPYQSFRPEGTGDTYKYME